jgi:hypothetical protein
LQGHTDWIRSIDIATFTATESNTSQITGFHDGDLIIATSSQDKYTRLWKIAEAAADSASTKSGNDGKDPNGADGFDQAIELLQALIGEEE